MIIAILIMIVLIAALSLYNIHSRLNGIFVMLITGFCLIMLALSLYIMKISYYNGIFALEYKMLIMLKRIHINLSAIKLIAVFGYIMIFIAQMFVFSEMNAFRKIKYRAVIMISVILAAGFFIVNLPDVSEKIYIYMTDRHSYSGVVSVDNRFKLCNYIIILYFVILPMPVQIRGILSTQMMFKKKQDIFITVSFAVFNAVIFLFSVITRINRLLRIFMFNMFEGGVIQSNDYDVILPMLVIAVLLIISFCIIRFDIFNTIDFLRNRAINKKMRFLIMDLKYIFHDFKNIMMTIIALKSVAEEKYGTEEGKQALQKIGNTALSYAGKVGDLLDIYKEKKIIFTDVDLLKCIKSAVSRIRDESSVPIYVINLPENPGISGDSYQIQTLFYNIMKNSAESVEKKNIPDGAVSVRFIEEGRWICVEFKDNGVGIGKKERKKIWKPFVSSKNTFLNWGIGLSHAKKIMVAHLGHIDIDSREGEYVKIQTAFSRIVK